MKKEQKKGMTKEHLFNLGFMYAVIAFMVIINYLDFRKNGDTTSFLQFLGAMFLVLLIIVSVNIALVKKVSDSSSGRIYTKEFDMKEIRYLKSGIKRCPICGGELERREIDVYMGNGKAKGVNTTIEGETYHKELRFSCESCQKEYALKELMKVKAPK